MRRAVEERQNRQSGTLKISIWTIGFLLFVLTAGGVKLTTVMHGASAQELDRNVPAQAVEAGPSTSVAVQIPLSTSAAPQTIAVASAADLQSDEVTIHIPNGARLPLTTLVVLHGIGASGPAEAAGLIQDADRLGWAIVAPTFRYGDWRDPGQLRVEDPKNVTRIAEVLDRLPDIVGYSVRRQTLLYGFSRGGQTAGRFALAYPERVAGAALASSGTYTLPVSSIDGADGPTLLNFPYGVGDFPEIFGRPFDATTFARVPFWIGVGGQDVNTADVPPQWTRYIGAQRVQRAEEYAGWLRGVGAEVQVDVFPTMAHGETPESRAAAMRFLSSVNRG